MELLHNKSFLKNKEYGLAAHIQECDVRNVSELDKDASEIHKSQKEAHFDSVHNI